MKALRTIVAAAALAAGLSGILAGTQAAVAQTTQPRVLSLSLDGVVDPFTASYVKKGIVEANGDAAGTSAVLLRIDTPGGLGSSMRDIIQAILASRVPVVCWVGPSGARAASAGTFILISCPVAAMAPGTEVGAAHPVGIIGAIESDKATNDAVAFIRSLAEQRGRNADWAESAVRKSESVSAEQALQLHVIDLLSTSAESLLGTVDGRTVKVANGESVTLHTAGALLESRSLGSGARILHALFTPDLAFLFFYAGLILLIVEFLHPGISVPGILGAILLIGSMVSFGLLPVTLSGLTLLAASAAAFIVDLKAPGHGIATGIGIVSLILGGLFLFDPSVPSAQVSRPLIAVVAVLAGLFFAVVVRAVLRAHHRPVAAGPESIVGEVGIAATDLVPAGTVRARGEEWSAEAAEGTILRGTRVRITGMKGLRLTVEPAMDDEEAAAAAGRGTQG